MDTNKNTYTVIYTIVLVAVVATILAVVSIGLKPKQQENIKQPCRTRQLPTRTPTFRTSSKST